MENAKLPGEEQAITLWPDVQSHARNLTSHKKNKRPRPPRLSGIILGEATTPHCEWCKRRKTGEGWKPSEQTCLRESSSQQFLLKVVPSKMVFTKTTVKAVEGRVSTEEQPEQNWISEKTKHPPPTKLSRFFCAFSEQIYPSEARKAKQPRLDWKSKCSSPGSSGARSLCACYSGTTINARYYQFTPLSS